jgi:hypothetical protein
MRAARGKSRSRFENRQENVTNMTIASIRRAFWLLPLVAACGGSSAPAAAPAPASSGAAAGGSADNAPPPSGKWNDMNRDQRMAYMKKVVMPKMKELFVTFDAKEFDHFTCMTCHGGGAKDGSFKMPNPELPKLNPEGQFKKHMEKHPEATKFMMTKVLPEMAGLLHTEPYDPQKKIGFGCFGCHAIEK